MIKVEIVKVNEYKIEKSLEEITNKIVNNNGKIIFITSETHAFGETGYTIFYEI